MRLLRPLSLIAVKIGAYQTFHSVDIQRIGLIINSQTRADDMITWNKGIFFILALRTGEEKIRILVDRVKNEMEVKVGVRPVIGIACYPSSVVTSHLELIRKAYSALAIAERQVDRIAVASEHGM
jgi:GGDEF domain-containing protein